MKDNLINILILFHKLMSDKSQIEKNKETNNKETKSKENYNSKETTSENTTSNSKKSPESQNPHNKENSSKREQSTNYAKNSNTNTYASRPRVRTQKGFLSKKEIIKELDKYVVNQYEAKNVLAAAGFIHQSRINKGVGDKSNVLIFGPSGSGKTYLVSNLSKILKLPMLSIDATALTASGYVGEKIDQNFKNFVQNYTINEIEKGIVFIDEIDKLAPVTRDSSVGTTEVQYDLLKVLEGKNILTQKGKINTENILFICAGAFLGNEKENIPSLKDMVLERYSSHKKNDVGFVTHNTHKNYELDEINVYSQVTPKDLRQYGLINELVGRIPFRTFVKELEAIELKKILIEPENNLVIKTKKFFDAYNLEIDFKDSALDFIAWKAFYDGSGARALSTYIQNIQKNLMDEIDIKQRIVLDHKNIEDYIK
ncbi:AAA family ATPase [Candidatus Woesearchaeota archaeon]|nr:AAA family ATPase [Candidatus Woesearchaeota archaeon]